MEKYVFVISVLLVISATANNSTLPRPFHNDAFGSSDVIKYSISREDDGNLNICEHCKVVVKDLRSAFLSPFAQVTAHRVLQQLCQGYVDHHGVLEDPELCKDVVTHYRPMITESIRAGRQINVCEMIGICSTSDLDLKSLPHKTLEEQQFLNCSENGTCDPDNSYENVTYGDKSYEQDSVRFTPEVQRSGRYKREVHMRLKRRQPWEPLVFVQFSDIHMDHRYKEEATTNCGAPSICCHSDIGKGNSGRFGDYHCDVPDITLDAILFFIQNMDPVPDFFVYAGDNSPHVTLDRLSNKLRDNARVNTLLVDKLRYIGEIFPTIGNHEIFPVSQYKRDSDNTQSILKALSQQWPALFLVDPAKLATIRKHAYYSAVVRPGLRILSINSLYEYRFNLAGVASKKDPVIKQQKSFIRRTLRLARKNGEKVIVLSHMKPSVSQTVKGYSEYMSQLVADFNDVIILQLYGHEHIDVFTLVKDPENNNTIGVALTAPSITTFGSRRVGTNPAFRVFKLDPNTFQPLDYDQYYVDLERANANGVAVVEKQYTFTEEYNLTDMSPGSFEILSDRIHENWSDYKKFQANYNVLADQMKKCEKHDVKCRRTLSCQTRESTLGRFRECVLQETAVESVVKVAGKVLTAAAVLKALSMLAEAQ